MAKEVKVNKVPNLRFSGFTEEWEIKKLGDLLEFKNGINATKEQYGSGYKFINVLDILNNEFITHDIIIGSVQVNEEIINKFPVNYGDILFQRSSETREEVGTTSVYLDKDKTATFGGFVIRGKKIGEYEPVFLNKSLKTDLIRNQITSKSGGSTRYNVGQEILASVTLPFPSLTEQTKIASFLSLIDYRIQTQNKIIGQLETLIKSVCQKLFTQKVRFKEFTNEWEVKILQEVLIKNSTKNKNQKYSTVQSVSNKYGLINQEEMFQDRRVASNDTSNYYIIKKGYFAYNPSRINVGSLAYKKDEKISVISPLYISFKANNDFLKDEFIWYWFKTIEFIKQMNNSFEGSVRNTLSYENLIKMNISVPRLEEQTKIADFLSKISDKIETEKTILEQLEIQKKYLLQQMFV